MTKALRQKVYDKYGGLCAYSGTPLNDNWQVDHFIPKRYFNITGQEGVNDFENLVPAQRIINHYKGSLLPDNFRNWYLGGLHKRLKKLPKNPRVQKSIRHKEYLLEVAELFGITPDKPFNKIFYFEEI